MLTAGVPAPKAEPSDFDNIEHENCMRLQLQHSLANSSISSPWRKYCMHILLAVEHVEDKHLVTEHSKPRCAHCLLANS